MSKESGKTELKSKLGKFAATLLVCFLGVHIGGIIGSTLCALALMARILGASLPEGNTEKEKFFIDFQPKAKKRRTYVINTKDLYAST